MRYALPCSDEAKPGTIDKSLGTQGGVGGAFGGRPRRLDHWTANFQGTTYVRLTFAEGATTPQGTMGIAQSIHGDDEGNVDGVIAGSFAPKRILDIRWNDGVLSFGVNDGPDVDRFEFRLIDATHAELLLILSEEERRQAAAEHLPIPKPFRLTKMP